MKRSIWLLWVVLVLVAFAAVTGGCGGGGSGEGEGGGGNVPEPPAGKTLTVSPARVTLKAGETAVIKASNNTGSVGWYSWDETVAAVKSTGAATALVTAVKAGTTSIVATDASGAEAECVVTVIPADTPDPNPNPNPNPDPDPGTDPEPDPNPDPNPEPELPAEDAELDYTPPLLSQEDVDAIYTAGYVEGKYEELVLPDGTYVKDRVEAMENTASGARAASNKTAYDYIAQIQQNAWDLINKTVDPKGLPTAHSVHQKKYVYILKQYNNIGQGTTQLNYQNWSGECSHGMFGLECVGFVMESVHPTGIPITNKGPYRTDERTDEKTGEPYTAYGLGSQVFWNGLLTGTSIEAEEVSVNEDPQPGDILVWNDSTGQHVAIAGQLNDGTIIILHSNGKTDKPYTCDQFAKIGQGPIYNAEAYQFENVGGPQYGRYSTYIGARGREQYRVRLIDSETTPAPGPADVWDGSIDTSWYDPTKTEFTITKASQLAGLAAIVNGDSTHSAWQDNFYGRTVTLGADIDLASRQWTPIGDGYFSSSFYHSYHGTFDGGGHTISNLTIDTVATERQVGSCGLFGHNSGDGIIKKVDLTGVNINVSYSTCAGGIVGYNYGTLTDCTASGSVSCSASRSYEGGIVGYNNGGQLKNCDASVSVTASALWSDAGGIVGENYWGSLMNCDASGSVSSYYSLAGGVIGRMDGSSAATANNTFTASTGQTWGIGWDVRKNPQGPSNDGCTPVQ
jgi:hypothetical protein